VHHKLQDALNIQVLEEKLKKTFGSANEKYESEVNKLVSKYHRSTLYG
jgi:hypothetical protein